MDRRGTTCFIVVFTVGCNGISPLLPRGPPPPPSLTFVFGVVSHIHISIPQLLRHSGFFKPFRKRYRRDANILLTGSALASGESFLELTGIGFVHQTQETPLADSHRMSPL